MRKSGWAVAGLVAAALLLTACGGGSGSSTTGGSTPTTSTAATPGAKTSNGTVSSPPPGTVYLHVQKSADGFVLALTDGRVVYTYSGDTKGKAGTCSGSCATAWPPVMYANPQVSPADTLPGNPFSTINGQVTYNGLPLYTFAGASAFSVHPNGQWHLIPMKASYVNGGV
jgi:predicted lipoprotein with Yx(FWY)xxD motif